MASAEHSETAHPGGPSHQRPELAGDGELILPAKVAFDHHGFLLGRLSERAVDPFAATVDHLLLAESFARLELTDRAAAKRWFVEHGALDLFDWTEGRAKLPRADWMDHRRKQDIADRLLDIRAEQANIRWHLETLVRLSERRARMDWDPAFGQLIVVSPDGSLIVGGPEAGAVVGSPLVIEALRLASEDDPRAREVASPRSPLLAATEGWPTVTVEYLGWIGHWRPPHLDTSISMPDEAKAMAKILGSTWDETVELERVLLAPYVERAMERRFMIWRAPLEIRGQTRLILVAREARLWRSILAPMYLQLFEALKRITLGQPGAAICRECGQPFLVLDARRRLFCNARERYRFTQRQRRHRLASEAAEPQAEADAIGQAVDEGVSAERTRQADAVRPDPALIGQAATKRRRRRGSA